MNEQQLFDLLAISIGGDKFTIVALFLILLAWVGFGGSSRSQPAANPQPSPLPVPVPKPAPAAPPAPVVPPAPPAIKLSSAKGSWYSQYQGKYTWVDNGDAPGSNALGVPDADQGISFLNRSTLGQWFEVHAPNGTVSIEQQTDIGPSSYTGRGIDISAACAERFGYSPKTFPTDGTFQWRSVAAPAVVANLSPVAQAIAYQKIRGTAAVTSTPTPAPATPTPTPAVVGDPPWLVKARSYNGLTWNHGPMPDTIKSWMQNIGTKFPEMTSECQMLEGMNYWEWCGGFVQAMLSYSNIRGPFGASDTQKWPWAFSWKDWGTDASDNPQPGDVLVFKWANGGGHVTFYDHMEDDNLYHFTGGDQGTSLQVSTESAAMSSCIAVRRPPAS